MRARLTDPLPGRCFAVILTAIVATTSCGRSSSNGAFQPSGTFGGTPAPPATTAAPPPSALPTAQVNQTVLQRYREYQRVYKQVYETNDPTPLAAVATDPLLTTVTKDVQKTKSKNEIWRFTNISNPRVYARSKDGLTVYVVDCLRTLAAYRFSAKTGKRLGGGKGTAYVNRTAVRYEGGIWKVSDTVRDNKC